MSANASTSILGVTQHCIQGEAALKTSRDCSDSQVGANCRRSKPACKVQVSLLFVEHHVVSLDMPPQCKWPEVVDVPIVSGDSQCSDVVSEVFGHLRGYLCPHATNYLHGYSHRTVSRVRSRRYSNCCEILWNIVHDCMVSTFPWRAGMAIFCMLWIS